MINILKKNRVEDHSSKILISFLFSILIALSSKISVPFYPVPMTMQTMLVLLSGIILGSKYGCLTLIFYIIEGMIGLPVFSGTPEKGIGLTYMLGPTGGYILGFAFTAFLSGLLFSNRKIYKKNSKSRYLLVKNLFVIFIKFTLALIPTYLIGLLWLGIVLGWDKPILDYGFYPFILGEFFKISLVTLFFYKLY